MFLLYSGENKFICNSRLIKGVPVQQMSWGNPILEVLKEIIFCMQLIVYVLVNL